MRLLVGTRGFDHDEWRGGFYPDKLKASHMLGYYALRLRTVEVGRTFYGMPKRHVLRRWSSATPADFVFTLTASRRITHVARLAEADEPLEELFSHAQLLGHKLGPVLFRCPADLRKDLGLLDAFLASVPRGARAALELRSRSWYGDDVLAVLERHGAALSVTDWEDPSRVAPLVPTARFGYFRMRRASYSDEALERWAERIVAEPWDHAFVVFAPSERAVAPKLALRMLEFVEAAQPPIKPLAKAKPPAADGAAGAPGGRRAD